ncbi:MAG: hypothetical protein FJ134_11305 [Deltaproteobacteria bacterium]|nr:hypothetical protein [Deltaproteobacteria bacterium]
MKRAFTTWESETEYFLKIPFDQKDRAKSISGYRWDTEQKCWFYPRTARIYDSIISEFGDDLVSIEITRPSAPTGKYPIVNLKAENQKLKDELGRLNKILAEKENILKIITNEKDHSKTSIESENKTLQIALQTVKGQLDDVMPKYELLQNQLKEKENEISKLNKGESGKIDQQLKQIARYSTGNDRDFCNFIDKLPLDRSAPIEIAKHLENTLRKLLSTNDRNLSLHDLITQARDAEILTEEAIQLAHLIRRHRNILAHEKIDIKTQPARVILVFISATLLWPLLPE